MKSSTSKAPLSETPSPMAGAAAEQNSEIQSVLAFADKFKDLSPLQQVAICSPAFADALKTDKARDAIRVCAGLFWGMGLDFGASLPQWVKLASVKGWQALGFGFIQKMRDGNPEAIGKFVELISWIQTTGTEENPARQEIDKLIQFIKGDAGNLSAEELKQFAEGRIAVPKMIERANNPSERTIVFLVIACAWQEIKKLGSHVKTHKWLADNKVISPNTDRAETSKWFREIGLPKGKAGRPRKNTDCTEIE